ncbi:MAG TPA: hypothetical protein VME86_08270 [Acidobacteriaceae bacterium]|nr:hypothetical protein [Acidobacteriaceae bacterium]
MKVLALLAVATLTISAGAQTATSTSTTTLTVPHHTQATTDSAVAASSRGLSAANTATAESGKMSAAQATDIQAKLTKNIDSKHAKVGDEVMAKTTSTATLADGTRLPKGTKLLGHVTEVSRESHADKASSLAFTFNEAMLRGGRELPIHAVLRSLTVPRPVSADADSGFGSDAQMDAGPVQGGGTMAGGGMLRGGAARGGGLLGGGANLAGGAVNGLATTTDHVGTETSGIVNSTTDTSMRGLNTTTNAAVDSGADVTTMPVGNLRGVTFQSSANAGSSAMLEGKGRNINLESGSWMTLAVSSRE